MNKKGFSWVTFLIVILCIAFVGLIVYLKFDAIKEVIFGEENIQQDQQELQIGEILELTGTLQETEDLLDSSHYVNHDTFAKVYLKSKSYNLFDYSGTFLIKGEVEEFLGNSPVLQVTSLVKIQDTSIVETGGTIIATGTQEEGEKEDTRYSFPSLGIWFDGEFSQNYNITEQSNEKVVFQLSGSDKTFTITSFVCQEGNAEKDCKDLKSTFEQSAEKDIVNPIGIKLYKLSEVKSRFFTENSRGYYINGADADTVAQVANDLMVNNEWYVKNRLLDNISKHCADNQVVLHDYNDYEFTQEGNKSNVTITYNNKDTGNVVCKLELNGKEVLTKKFEYGEYKEETDKKDDQDTQDDEDKDNIDKDSEEEVTEDEQNNTQDEDEDNQATDEQDNTPVEQFPLRPDKALTFNSARGHKIVFPSPSIAYQEVSSSENFDQNGVHCFAQLNVINYTNEDKLLESPDVRIYECSVKNDFDDSSNNLIYKKVEDKHFVIEIANPAWKEFAHNIDIAKRE